MKSQICHHFSCLGTGGEILPNILCVHGGKNWLGGGGGVALERNLFVLPIVRSQLELFLMRPLQAKFGKISQWTKKIKDTVVYGWGRQIFPKSPKENKNSSNVSAACLFKKIDAQYCLEKPFISVYTRI